MITAYWHVYDMVVYLQYLSRAWKGGKENKNKMIYFIQRKNINCNRFCLVNKI